MGRCVGVMSPYSVSGANPQPPNVALDEGKSLLFFLSYAQKVRVRSPTPKSGGGSPVIYAYDLLQAKNVKWCRLIWPVNITEINETILHSV